MDSNSYFSAAAEALCAVKPASLEGLARCVYDAWEKGRTVFICGNGGSANNANHLAQDLCKGTLVRGVEGLSITDGGDIVPHTFVEEVEAIHARSLCANIGLVMAWANDNGYEWVFYEQLRSEGKPGDVLIAISGSGNSENVLNAVRLANDKLEMKTWGITGFNGGKLLRLAHHCVHVPSGNMGIVEAVHGVIFHWLVERLRAMRAREKEWLGVPV